MLIVEEEPSLNFPGQRSQNSRPCHCPRGCGRAYPRNDHVRRHLIKPCKPKESDRHKQDHIKRLIRPVVHVRGYDGIIHEVLRDDDGQLPCIYGCGKGFSRQDGLKIHVELRCNLIPGGKGKSQCLGGAGRLEAAVTTRGPGERINLSKESEEKVEKIRQFHRGWKAEACKLGIPHCEVGSKILDFLENNPDKWVEVLPHNGTTAIFERKPTIEDFIADVHAAERNETLKIIDTALGSRDEMSKDSAKRVIECCEQVKAGTYSTKSHRHCCAFDIPASMDGLLKCLPKVPPQHLLTSTRFTPRGDHSSDYTLILPVPLITTDSGVAPKFNTVLSPGGSITGVHIDYCVLAQILTVFGEGAKLFITFEPNENNLRLMSRRHRSENPIGWDSDLSRFEGIRVIILTDDTWFVLPESMPHAVITQGLAVVTGCEFARAEGREDEPLAALAWDLARIRSRLAGGDVTLLGLESLYRDCCELDAEPKFLQPVPGSTVAQGKALRAFIREIQVTRREIQAKIEEGEMDINISRKRPAARANKPLKRSKQKVRTAKRKSQNR